jgi:hypothetical protein
MNTKKQNFAKHNLLDYLGSSTKKIIRSTILTLGLSSALLTTGYAADNTNPQNQEEGGLFPVKQVEESKSSYDSPKIIGSMYGEGGVYSGIFDETPAMLNISGGYNILDRTKSEGVLLFPNVRASLRGNNLDNPGSNYLDVGVGAAYQKAPFIVGVEEVFRNSFKKEGVDGEFFRAWGGFWDSWQQKELEPSAKFPNRLWGTFYGDGEYNTLEKDLVGTFRADTVLDLVNFGGFVAGPYAAGKVSMDVKDKSYYRYGQVSGGLRIRKGPFNLFLEVGDRESFNKDGLKGSYCAAFVGGWIPFGK